MTVRVKTCRWLDIARNVIDQSHFDGTTLVISAGQDLITTWKIKILYKLLHQKTTHLQADCLSLQVCTTEASVRYF